MPPSQKKPRLSLHQMIFFSVGHILNDLINSVYTSYLLTFQTKILGLPTNVVGLLWLIPAGIEAPLSLVIGYVSDNFSIPYLSKFYGKRKSWHLIGCSLVGLFTPFMLMPCFVCGEQNDSWIVVVYYVTLLVCVSAGWGLTQANFLALIPEVAKRQSEMIKLGAINSAITLMCGIYVYVVTWVLLGRDSSETLSFSQWKEFMNLAIIVVATGAFFALIFHVGTREPSSKRGKEEKMLSKSNESKRHEFSMESYGGSKPAPSTLDGLYQSTHACNVSDVIQGKASTAIVNPSFEEDEKDNESCKNDKSTWESKKDNEIRLDVAELENHLWQALSDHDNRKDKFKTEETDSVEFESSGYEGDSSLEGTDVESVELCMPETFMDMVPNHSALILSSRRESTRASPFPSPRLSRSPSKRIPKSQLVSERTHVHPHSTGIDYGFNPKIRSRLNSETQESPFPSPRLSRSAFNRFSPTALASEDHHMRFPTGIDPKIRSRINSETQESPLASPRLPKSTSFRNQSHLALEVSKSDSLEMKSQEKLGEMHLHSVALEDGEVEREAHKRKENDFKKENCTGLTITDRSKCKTAKTKTWKTLFKSPVFYKLGAAYMLTRLSQNIVNSYLPLYLTDHLKFEKASIAYFPLVILISGVFSSLAAKKLNKLLGNKWTFVLGSAIVIGSSGWFYLLTEETRSFAYIPAIISGSGTSIMFVTTLALAAEFVDADKSSGAFLMASMGFFAKISLGILFGLLQKFSPEKNSSDCPECAEYVRYVFSLTPAVSAFFGVVAFVLFIPATIHCRPITETVDAETQTDAFPFHEPATNTLEIIKEDETKTGVSQVVEQRILDIKLEKPEDQIKVHLEALEPQGLDTRL